MIRLFLIGYMGSGKTTLGKAYAQAAGLSFIDLDWYIEERYHKTISKIFAEKGEQGFREVERKMLHEVGDFEDVVIACGGGTPCFFDNMDFMNAAGCTVFLNASCPALFRRLRIAKAKRPLLADKSDDEIMEVIQRGLDKRMDFYQKAKVVLDSDRLESHAQINGTIEELKRLLREKGL